MEERGRAGALTNGSKDEMITLGNTLNTMDGERARRKTTQVLTLGGCENVIAYPGNLGRG